jgi:hypothetical protein
MGAFVDSDLEHYEIVSGHLATTRAPTPVQKGARARETWRDGILEAFLRAAVWGSPDRIPRELEPRREAAVEFELCTAFRYGGTPYELSENSMRLYARDVLAVLKSWGAGPARVIAAK